MKEKTKVGGIALRVILVSLLAMTMVPALAFANEETVVTEEEITSNETIDQVVNNEEEIIIDEILDENGQIIVSEVTGEETEVLTEEVVEEEEVSTLEAEAILPANTAVAHDDATFLAALADSSISTIILEGSVYNLYSTATIDRDLTLVAGRMIDDPNFAGVTIYAAPNVRHFNIVGGSSLTFAQAVCQPEATTFEEKWTLEGQTHNIILSGNGKGGGILVSVTGGYSINGAVLSFCYSGDKGGAIMTSFDANANVTVNNSIINNNTAVSNGGGIYVAGALTINNSTVKENLSIQEQGGGIFAGSVVANQCTITTNVSTNLGGGIITYNGNMDLTGCTVTGNLANFGGGLYTDGHTITLNATSVTGNKAVAGLLAGGGIFTKGSSSAVVINDGSVVSNNTNTGIASEGSVTVAATSAGVQISNNTERGIQASGNVSISAASAAAPAVVSGHTLRGIDAGGTLTLTAAEANGVVISNNKTGSHATFGGARATGNITVNNCLFEGNEAGSWGGALGSQSSSIAIDIRNTTFRNNACGTSGYDVGDSFGGAISAWTHNSFYAENCVFEGNRGANNGTGSAAQVSPNAQNTFVNCTFAGNANTSGYAAIHIWYMPGKTDVIGTTSFNGCTFTGNSGKTGGAITCYNPANIAIDNCSFTGNTATWGGALAIYGENSTYTIKNTTFDGNTAGTSGGAIYTSRTSTMDISNSKFMNSSAYYGGAIYSTSNMLALSNTSLSNNEGVLGGAVYAGWLKELVATDVTFTSNMAEEVYAGYPEKVDTDEDSDIDEATYAANMKNVTFDSIYKSAYNNADVYYEPQNGVYDHLVSFWDHDYTLLDRQVVKTGDSATPPGAPSHAGMDFAGWVGVYENVDSNRDVYATYEQAPVVTPPVVTPVEPSTPNPVDPSIPGTVDEGTAEEVVATAQLEEEEPVRPRTIQEAAADEDIANVGVPLTAPEGFETWALANLMLVVLAGLMTIIFGAQRLGSRSKRISFAKDAQAAEEESSKQSRTLAWIIGAAVASVAGVILFVLTQDMSLSMVWADSWTIASAAIAVVAVALGIVSVWPTKAASSDSKEISETL